MEPGDWTCLSCNEMNFKKRSICRKCGKAKSSDLTYLSMSNDSSVGNSLSKDQNTGDWQCKSCNEINFKKRTMCRECGKDRKSWSNPINDKICGKCNKSNFASRTLCRFCDSVLPVTDTKTDTKIDTNTDTKIKYRQDDWICPKESCKEHNFKIRYVCRKCFTPKPSTNVSVSSNSTSSTDLDNTLVSNPDNASSEAGSELCSICFDRQKTHAIKKCGHLCFCEVCCYALNKCPICRESYNSDTDLLRIFSC
jgi:hypothetical protein